MWYFWLEANMFLFFIVCLYIYILPLEIETQLSRRVDWDSIKRFNPPHICDCPTSMSWRCLFMFNDLRSEVIVRFVDIVEIVNYHCLAYIFSFPVKIMEAFLYLVIVYGYWKLTIHTTELLVFNALFSNISVYIVLVSYIQYVAKSIATCKKIPL